MNELTTKLKIVYHSTGNFIEETSKRREKKSVLSVSKLAEMDGFDILLNSISNKIEK